MKTESLGSLSPASSDAENARSTFTRQTSISHRSSYETEYKSLTKKKLIEDETAETGAILQEIQPGYMLGERLLRPALVAVAKKKTTKNEEKNKKKEEN